MTVSINIRANESFQVPFNGASGLNLTSAAPSVTTSIGPPNTFTFTALSERTPGCYDLSVSAAAAFRGSYTIWVNDGTSRIPVAWVKVDGALVSSSTGLAIDTAETALLNKRVDSFQHYGTYAPGERIGLMLPMGVGADLQNTSLTNIVAVNMTDNTSLGQVALENITESLFGNGIYFASTTAPEFLGTYVIQWAHGTILGTFNVSAGGSSGGGTVTLEPEVMEKLQNLEDAALGSWQWDKATGSLKFYRQSGDEFAEFNVVEDATTASRERV